MQLIDIAVGTGYAVLCITLIVLMNPIAAREGAVEAAADSRVDSAILAYLGQVGLPFLTSSTESSLCASGLQASNSTFVFDVSLQGAGCEGSPSPSPFAPHSSLTLDLPGRVVVIQAWLEGQ